MAQPAPIRALCLYCHEIVNATANFDAVITLSTAGMAVIHKKETIKTEYPDDRPDKLEKIWARTVKDEDRLQPIHLGKGKCKECSK